MDEIRHPITERKYKAHKNMNDNTIPVDTYLASNYKGPLENNNPIQNPWAVDEFIEENEELLVKSINSKKEGAQ